MPVSLRTDLEVNAALNFVDTHDSTPGTNNVYVGIGKSTPWVDELNPPVPLDTIQDMKGFWNNLIGLQKVELTDISFVVPRINWTASTEYYLFDETSVTAYNQSFYVMNSNLEVYKCVGKTGGVGSLSTIEPTGHNNGATIVLADGYSWDFMYDISPQDFADMMTNTWMYVNWGDSQSLNQGLYGDVDAVYTLGAKYAMVRINLKDTASGGLPDNTQYRQVAVIRNPLDQTSLALQAGTTVLPASLTPYSGQMLYLENKYVIQRNPGQSEEIKIVITF